MTSTVQYNHCPMMLHCEQLNKQEKTNTNEDHDYIIVDQQNPIVQLTMMNYEKEIELEEEEEDYDGHGDEEEYHQEIESTRLFDNEQHNGYNSDQLQYSDDIRN
ncbi:unnamed protein product [Adineta steineri]|nr:unnamed protein product [Adineta steineri]